jgi:hypothetical protein
MANILAPARETIIKASIATAKALGIQTTSKF